MIRKIRDEIDESIRVLQECKMLAPQILEIVDIISDCFRNKNKIVLFGNGGSAADSQHIAAEFVGRFVMERKSLPAIALTTDTSVLTALANDYSFSEVFSRQCESIVTKGDVVIGISTSGNSQNVINGIQTSKEKGAKTIGILGNEGGKLKNVVDVALIIPSSSTPKIQESHRALTHIICRLVEERFYQKNK